MENSKHLIPQDKLKEFCGRWQIKEFSLFGSVLREDFGPRSDIDVLVAFDKNAKHTLFKMARMRKELQELAGREVDILTRAGIERSRNHIRRNAILSSAETLYVA